jgi:hypothetical protein
MKRVEADQLVSDYLKYSEVSVSVFYVISAPVGAMYKIYLIKLYVKFIKSAEFRDKRTKPNAHQNSSPESIKSGYTASSKLSKKAQFCLCVIKHDHAHC